MVLVFDLEIADSVFDSEQAVSIFDSKSTVSVPVPVLVSTIQFFFLIIENLSRLIVIDPYEEFIGKNKIHLDRKPLWMNKMIHIASLSNLYGNLIINLPLEKLKKNQEFSTKLINYFFVFYFFFIIYFYFYFFEWITYFIS